jgi:hypothetical protein
MDLTLAFLLAAVFLATIMPPVAAGLLFKYGTEHWSTPLGKFAMALSVAIGVLIVSAVGLFGVAALFPKHWTS